MGVLCQVLVAPTTSSGDPTRKGMERGMGMAHGVRNGTRHFLNLAECDGRKALPNRESEKKRKKKTKIPENGEKLIHLQ